jgi:hypothetical protein
LFLFPLTTLISLVGRASAFMKTKRHFVFYRFVNARTIPDRPLICYLISHH